MATGGSDLPSSRRVSLKAAGDELSTCSMAKAAGWRASIAAYCNAIGSSRQRLAAAVSRRGAEAVPRRYHVHRGQLPRRQRLYRPDHGSPRACHRPRSLRARRRRSAEVVRQLELDLLLQEIKPQAMAPRRLVIDATISGGIAGKTGINRVRCRFGETRAELYGPVENYRQCGRVLQAGQVGAHHGPCVCEIEVKLSSAAWRTRNALSSSSPSFSAQPATIRIPRSTSIWRNSGSGVEAAMSPRARSNRKLTATSVFEYMRICSKAASNRRSKCIHSMLARTMPGGS